MVHMSLPEMAPRRALRGVLIVWIAAAVVAVVIGVVAPPEWRAAWMPIGLGGCVLLAFGVHMWHGTSRGFIQRVGMSVLGALAVMGLIGIGFGMATLFAG